MITTLLLLSQAEHYEGKDVESRGRKEGAYEFMAGSTTGHADDEVHRMCFRLVSSERNGHMNSHTQFLNWPCLAHTQPKALQDFRYRRSLPKTRDCRRGGRDRWRTLTVPKSFFSSFRKK